MAENVHIVNIYDTKANIRSDGDALQSGIDTDEEWWWLDNDGSDVHYANKSIAVSDGAITYKDLVFDDVTVEGDLYGSEYIYHYGDTDTYLRFQTDQITLSAGGVDFIDIIEGADDYVQFLEDILMGDSVLLRLGSGADSALYDDGSDIYIDFDNQGAGSRTLKIQSDTTDILTISDTEAIFSVPVDSTGTFGEIYVHDGSTAQTIANGATYTKSTAFTTDGASNDCTPNAANDRIDITRTGVYRVEGSVTFSSDTNNIDVYSAVFLGGTEQSNIHIAEAVGVIGDVASSGLTGFIDVTDVSGSNGQVDLRFRHDNGSNVNITVLYANLNVQRIGAT
jgi:hypothetical protein